MSKAKKNYCRNSSNNKKQVSNMSGSNVSNCK